MLVLLHCCHPGDVVECHHLESEVFIVADLLHFFKEGVEVGGGDVVNVCDKVGRCELLCVS